MTAESFLGGRVLLYPGDCLDVLDGLADGSVDACVCDPPYGLGFMAKRWDAPDNIAFRPETWAKVLRVLKPGAHLAAFGGTRTSHRMACTIEDAGFEIRDTVAWIYGSGFPKSLDVSKAIDREAGKVREVIGRKHDKRYLSPATETSGAVFGNLSPRANAQKTYAYAGFITSPATDEALKWSGFGTALKPAFEPIVLARKPLAKGMTIAENVLAHGTGAINIDGCRIAGAMGADLATGKPRRNDNEIFGVVNTAINPQSPLGRFPANVVLDGSEEVIAGFPETNAGGFPASRGIGGIGNDGHRGQENLTVSRTDEGSASRFFYTAKADSFDRVGSKHPTVKPLDLMQWLVRLVTPPGGVLIDPFAGTGTTGEAAWREGMTAILIEADSKYQDDIARRMALATSGRGERSRESLKAAGKVIDDAGPLFGGKN